MIVLVTVKKSTINPTKLSGMGAILIIKSDYFGL